MASRRHTTILQPGISYRRQRRSMSRPEPAGCRQAQVHLGRYERTGTISRCAVADSADRSLRFGMPQLRSRLRPPLARRLLPRSHSITSRSKRSFHRRPPSALPLANRSRESSSPTATVEEAGNYSILESLGGGVGLFDFDVDGRLDVFLPGGGGFAPGPNVTGSAGRAVSTAGAVVVRERQRTRRNRRLAAL